MKTNSASASVPASKSARAEKNSGLAHWMRAVQKEIVRAGDGFHADPVHDLRVALRRCRSMVDGLRAIDPDKSWKKMRRQATELFDSLGDLRDCQVLMEWVEQLGKPDDPVTQRLLAYAKQKETECKEHARAAVARFDQEQWERLTASLPRRAARLRPGSDAFKAIALEKWTDARMRESAALKTGSPAAFHRLRISVKKLRYVVENFLPDLHEQWGSDFKKVQDWLGEIHDLDVLRDTAITIGAYATDEETAHWNHILRTERDLRIERYKAKMVGEASLWKVWRAGLPSGPDARQASLGKLQAWSSFLESDQPHSRRVARLALQIHDGLAKVGVLEGNRQRSREMLRAAAIVHEVGRHEGGKGHHKATQKMVGELDRLVGWTRQEQSMIALIARYHRGALPSSAKLREVPLEQRKQTKLLSGILRLANAFDADRDGAIRRIAVSKQNEFILIQAEGLNPESALAETIAGARHLLEITCGIPVMVRTMPGTSRKPVRLSAK